MSLPEGENGALDAAAGNYRPLPRRSTGHMKTLDTLSPGQSAEVTAVHGEGTSLRRRLLDMGITPKTQVTMIRSAPLGDPIELSLRHYELTIRKSDARLVEIS